jgi:hypothetical protein
MPYQLNTFTVMCSECAKKEIGGVPASVIYFLDDSGAIKVEEKDRTVCVRCSKEVKSYNLA